MTLKQTVVSLLAVPLIALGLVATATPMQVSAACSAGDKVSGIDEGADCAGSNQQPTGLRATIEIVTRVLLFIIGAVSVIMIIIGGLRYVISNGDSSQVTSAKNTILYAVVGLVIALLAYAIVNFVLQSFIPSGASGGPA
mgnify:CR=1 FL=1